MLKNLNIIIKSQDIIEKAAHNVEPNVGKAECKCNQEKYVIELATIKHFPRSHHKLR